MIWRRLKKVSKEEEDEYRKQVSEMNLSFKDKFAMAFSAILVIVIPSLLVLGALALLVLWLFGAFS